MIFFLDFASKSVPHLMRNRKSHEDCYDSPGGRRTMDGNENDSRQRLRATEEREPQKPSLPGLRLNGISRTHIPAHHRISSGSVPQQVYLSCPTLFPPARILNRPSTTYRRASSHNTSGDNGACTWYYTPYATAARDPIRAPAAPRVCAVLGPLDGQRKVRQECGAPP